MCRATELNLATVSCAKYENEVLPAAASNPGADSINTVMWLFGYSVGKSGAHVMYPDGLSPFGFSLDNECKSNPIESLLDALAAVKPEARNPMNLIALDCAAFASRHMELERTDSESATTIMMWLFGFAVAKSGSHIFDADLLTSFHNILLADCAKQPSANLFDTLSSVRMPKAAKAPHP
jgi:hypothetical protein